MYLGRYADSYCVSEILVRRETTDYSVLSLAQSLLKARNNSRNVYQGHFGVSPVLQFSALGVTPLMYSSKLRDRNKGERRSGKLDDRVCH